MSDATNQETVDVANQILAELAQAAKDGQLIQNDYYATEAEGRAAVADGDTFKVVVGGDIAARVYRRLSAATSEPLFEAPSASLAQRSSDSLSVEQYGAGYSDVLPIPAGTANAAGLILLDWPQIAGRISKMHINSAAAGVVDVYVYSKSGDTFTLQRQEMLNVPAAGYHALPLSLSVNAGEYIAVRGVGGSLTYVSAIPDGYGIRSGTVGPSFTQPVVNTSSRMMVRFDVTHFTGHDQLTPTLERDINHVISQTLTETREQRINNVAPFASAPWSLSGSGSFILASPASNGGRVIFECLASAAGSVKVALLERISESRFVQRAVERVAVVTGENRITLAAQVRSGEYFSISSPVIAYGSEASQGTSAYFTRNFADGVVWTYSTNIRAGFRVISDVAPKGGRVGSVNLPWESMLLIGLGQSLMEGSQTPTSGTEPITVTQEYDSVGFPAYPAAPTILLPATVANTQRTTWTPRGEWPGLAAAASIRRALLRQNQLSPTDVKSTVVVANNAVGGTPIADMSKGTAQYNACIAQATALSGVSGGTAGVLAVIFGQGESDSDASAYLPAILKIAADIDSDLRAATGQSKQVPFLAYQVSSANRPIALAQLAAARQSQLISLVAPMYMLSYYDSQHIDSISSRRLGGYYGEAVKAVAINGGVWEPLWPIGCDVSGNYVTLTFNKAGLVIDTALVPAQTNMGFAVSGTTVSSVSVINGRQVRLQCAAAPAVGAMVSYGNAAVGKGPYVGRAGNLRDSRGETLKFDDFPLHNWCLEFDWTV
ncbi:MULTISPECIES: sialate O-acetylesterase [Comamonas]|uniref:sialate O-acetylesterase n=1 Tax=Comamonas TaxID=283 RepID=UPI0001DA6B94|nr:MULTISPECIES: sialate O-acetylesterase [Comamonas]EFI63727.1 hypothetical protein CTS44_00454 [Comamonas thiooxydans]TFF59282.1 hypothetical protein EIC84_15825 [Comamonas sp. A23]